MKVEGKCGISAEIIKDSVSPGGQRLTTFEFVYPRWILAEIDTHRMLSKNSASSRAVPVQSMFEQILGNAATPVHWGKNQAGMTSKEELSGTTLEEAKVLWSRAAESAVNFAEQLSSTEIAGHKQWVNRLTENFTRTKTVISGTEWANFFWLRDHPDAQPEFQELARCAREAYDKSSPRLLLSGEWHLPYVDTRSGLYWSGQEQIDLETAKQISASCCAQVSYRKLDESVEKAKKIFGMLNIGSKELPQHVSPVEHQATPMLFSSAHTSSTDSWEPGVTHQRRDGSLWSGNFKGWIQYRQLIPGEAKW